MMTRPSGRKQDRLLVLGVLILCAMQMLFGMLNKSLPGNDVVWRHLGTSFAKEHNQEPSECIPVYLLPSHDHEKTIGEHYHFIVDGVIKSPYLTLTNNNTEGSIWIIDRVRAENAGGCKQVVINELQDATKARWKKYGDSLTSSKASNWTLINIDWNDGPYHWKCNGLEQFVGKDNVLWNKRSLVGGKEVNVTNDSHHEWSLKPGGIIAMRDQVKHIPYAVRTDQIEAISAELKHNYSIGHYPNEAWNLADLDRSQGPDVCHFWPLLWHKPKHQCSLRDAVSFAIDELGKQQNISTHVKVTGKRTSAARKQIQTSYVQALLRCKIVVVTQRDTYEDHYRLMEALSSGAMVLSDPMLSLPYGYEEGKNIVFFHNKSQLHERVLYFLSNEEARLDIARKGWKEAMSRHRSWHVVEKLVFGEIRTNGIVLPETPSCV